MPLLLRHAARALAARPAPTLALVLTLALGIGLASATAVVARAIAFAGLPVRDAERVAVLWGADAAGTLEHLPLAPRHLPALAEAMRGVAEVAAGDYNGAYPWVFRAPGGDATPLRLRGTLVGGRWFALLGARPVLGRALRADDDVIGAPRVAVLSHAAWRRQFGGDPRVLGRTVASVEQGAPYTIVGVMPPGLDVPRGVEFWTALAPTAAVNGSLERTPWAVDVYARLAPGATPERARAALERFYRTLDGPEARLYATARATVRTLPAHVHGDARPAFGALAAAAAVVLLATCGNVAGLVLVRAAGRRRELAVRAALGAERGRLARQLLAEHALLAGAGGALGAAVAAALVRAFAALAPAELPHVADLGVDWRVLAAAAALTALVLLLVGVAPAVRAARVAPAAALGGGRMGAGGGRGERRTRRGLVGAQVALALVVLAGAGLVGRSLARLTALDLGLPASERLAVVQLVPSVAGPAGDPAAATRWIATLDAVAARVRAAPGIVAVAPVVKPPFSGTGGWDARLEPEGAAPDDTTRRPFLNLEVTSDAYLRTTGVPLRAGRFVTEADRAGAPGTVVLSARAARLLFPDADAVGRRVRFAPGAPWVTVAGVVGDTRWRAYVEPRPTVYFPYRQFPAAPTYLVVRTAGDPAAAVGAVRRAVGEVAPAVLVGEHGTMRALAAVPLARPRLLSAVLGAYALVTVLLAVAGLYAVVAAAVAHRTREFGVRASLGATPAALRALVLRDGVGVALAGAGVGVALVLAGARLIGAVLHDVAPTDPATLGGAAALLLAVCAAAALVPARRAARTDPAVVLRAE